ncbi:MAG: hypothetical protein WC959_00335 [Kiritimatiellales bacterium]
MRKISLLIVGIFLCIGIGMGDVVMNINFNDDTTAIENWGKVDYNRKAQWNGSLAANNTLGFMTGSTSTKYRFDVPGALNVLYCTGAVNYNEASRGIYFANLDMTAGGANTSREVLVSYSFDIIGASSSEYFVNTGWTVEINSANTIANYDLATDGGGGYTVINTFDVENAGRLMTNISNVSWTTVTGQYAIAVGEGSEFGMLKVRPQSSGYIASGDGMFAIDNIRIDISPVPEPGSIQLFLIGAGYGFFILFQRFKNN